MFAWEMQETADEEVPVASLHFYDNKNSVDQLMGRPMGLFYILDEASRTSSGQEFIMSKLIITLEKLILILEPLIIRNLFHRYNQNNV